MLPQGEVVAWLVPLLVIKDNVKKLKGYLSSVRCDCDYAVRE